MSSDYVSADKFEEANTSSSNSSSIYPLSLSENTSVSEDDDTTLFQSYPTCCSLSQFKQWQATHPWLTCGNSCHRKSSIPTFWHPRGKYPSVFETPTHEILRNYGTPIGTPSGNSDSLHVSAKPHSVEAEEKRRKYNQKIPKSTTKYIDISWTECTLKEQRSLTKL